MSNIKTPISILQETLMKHGDSLPSYTEIYSTVEFQETKFTNQCAWKNYKVRGIGSTKKEAKQNAAKEMIELLSSKGIIHIPCLISDNKKENEKPSNVECNLQSSVNLSNSSACSQEVFVNYVGSLMEFCVANKLSVPCFNNVSSTGLPHNFIFTMSCTVGSLCKEGSGSTKKVAKQKAAKEVLETLRGSTTDAVNELIVEYKNLKLIEPKSNNEDKEEIANRYKKIRNISATCTKELLVKDYHFALMGKCQNILEVQQHNLKLAYEMKKCFTEDISVTKTIIKNIFNTSVETVKIRSKKHMQYIVGVRLLTTPLIFQVGIDTTFEQAERAALHKLFGRIIFYMK